jgi:Calx-beta domain
VKRNLIVVLVGLTLTLATVPGSSGAGEGGAGPQLATPDLLDRAVDRGEVRRARADLYLIYALSGDTRLPARYRSDVPWDGTLPLLHLRRRVQRMDRGAQRATLRSAIEQQALASCGGKTGGSNTLDTTHFHIEYGTIGGGLTANHYGTSLETSWTKEVTTFGWAAPPLSSARYLVVVANLSGGLYGFVTTAGSPPNGNNPNTSWNDGDARFSCMALNRDYSGFPSSPQASLDSTTAHEFNHSIQFGYGALNGMVPGDVFVEGGATWMEDEVFDGANDNYNFLWPNFADGMANFTSDPYNYWIVYRALTERYGTGVAAGGEQVMQDFWELVSKNTSNNTTALNTALTTRGTNLADAYHAAGISVKFLRACGGGYSYPYCLEEGPAIQAQEGLPAVHKTIASVGGSVTGSLEGGYALNWVQIPKNAGTYNLTLNNTSTVGQLVINAFPSVVGAGQSTVLNGFNSSSCTSAVLVLTNQSSSSSAASYQVTSTGGGGGGPTVSIANASKVEGTGTDRSIRFRVTLSQSSAGPVTVGYATANGTAVAPADYTAKSGTVTFSAGETSRRIGVGIRADSVNEPNETFSVVLSNASGATISDGTGVGTILDDD